MSRILVAEDDPDIAELVAHHLSRAGYMTEIVALGGDVLGKVRENPPDLLILDLMLPGMNGLEVCRALRSDRGTR